MCYRLTLLAAKVTVVLFLDEYEYVCVHGFYPSFSQPSSLPDRIPLCPVAVVGNLACAPVQQADVTPSARPRADLFC